MIHEGRADVPFLYFFRFSMLGGGIQMETFRRLALALIIIGAINWGLIGFFQFDLVGALFGGQSALLSRIIFALVGLSGLACISLLFEPVRDVVRDIRGYDERNVNYSTEFGEETDLSELKKKD